MVDTSRSQSTLLASLFQDGQASGAISEQDVRDLIVSLTQPFMGVYVSAAAATTIASAGVPVKAAGTTTITNQSGDMDDNSGVSNRIRFTGVSPRHMHVVAHASVSLASGTNQDTGLHIWKWDDSAGSGAFLPESEAHTTIAGTASTQLMTHGDTLMDTNDYLELWVANHTGTPNITVDYGYLFAVGMLV